MVASQAQRRVRACILEIIPGDIIEEAQEICKVTLGKAVGDMAKAVPNMLESFADLGVTQEDIERRLGRKIASLVPADLVSLRRIHTSITQGIAAKEEFFKPEEVKDERVNGLAKDFADTREDNGGGHSGGAAVDNGLDPEQERQIENHQSFPGDPEPGVGLTKKGEPTQKALKHCEDLKRSLMSVPAEVHRMVPNATGSDVVEKLDLWIMNRADEMADNIHSVGIEEIKSIHKSLRNEYINKK